MYKIVYAKMASKAVPKLKAAHLTEKAKMLIDLLRENPFQNPPPYEKFLMALIVVYSRRINEQ